MLSPFSFCLFGWFFPLQARQDLASTLLSPLCNPPRITANLLFLKQRSLSVSNSYQWYITGEQSPLRSRDFSNRPWFQLWATSFSPLPPPTETVLCSELAKPWAHLFLVTQIRTHNANPCNQPVKFSSFLCPALYIQEYWEWQPS